MKSRPRLAYLVSHPIQYQAPLLRRISVEANIDLTVFFCSDLSVQTYLDDGFGQAVQWDVPLLEGYRYEFLPAIGKRHRLSFFRPLNYGLFSRLRAGKFDALWLHGWGYWSHLHAIHAAHRLGIKVLMRGESGLHLDQPMRARGIIKQTLLRYLVTRVDGFLAIGTLNREFYQKQGVQPDRIFPVPYAVDNAFFQAKAAEASASRESLRQQLGLESGRPVILYASKMTPRKRADDLLEAYHRLSPDGKIEPQPYLLFIGDGELRPRLAARVRELGWHSVRFLGFKNQTELPAYYDLCDVFVLPSVQEPWGLVINEVMNAGKAVIVSDEVGCGPDLVKDGDNGYVFRAGDIDDLHRVLAEAFANPERTAVMGRRSLALINRWGFDEDITGLQQALRGVLGNA